MLALTRAGGSAPRVTRGGAVTGRPQPTTAREAVEAGKLKIVSARYDLDTGAVEVLE